MTTNSEIYEKLGNTVDSHEAISKAQIEILKADANQKITLPDGSQVKSLTGRVGDFIQAVQSVNGEIGAVKITRESLKIPSDELLARQNKEDRFVITEDGRTQREVNSTKIDRKDLVLALEPKADKLYVDQLVINANKGMNNFKTEVELLAFRPTQANYTGYALDTKKTFLWDGSKWNDTGLSEKDLAISYTNDRVSTSINPNVQPIVVDPNGNCPIWIQDGRIGISALSEKASEVVASQLGLGKDNNENINPICADSSGNVPLWLQGGLLNFAGIHLDALKKIENGLKNTSLTNYPILSNSTSLRQWKAKASKLKSGITQQLNVVLTGDSWTEHNTIASELISILKSEYGQAGSGWINLGAEKNMLDGVTIDYSGTWAVNDLNNTAANFPYGCAPDGFTRTSTTIDSSISIGNLRIGDSFTAFFGKTIGTFSYSVNGGAEVVVDIASTNGSVTIPLTTTTSSSIVFKVKSGAACFFGFHMRKTTGLGVEFNRIGNGGATGQDYLKISPQAQTNFSSFLKPDVLIIILGTNDHRLGHSVENFKLGVSAIISGFKSANPNCGVILVAPAKSNATAVLPLENYRNALYELSLENKCEFYNMYDDWTTFALENVNNMWNDSLHISKAGAYRLSKTLFKNFLEM